MSAGYFILSFYPFRFISAPRGREKELLSSLLPALFFFFLQRCKLARRLSGYLGDAFPLLQLRKICICTNWENTRVTIALFVTNRFVGERGCNIENQYRAMCNIAEKKKKFQLSKTLIRCLFYRKKISHASAPRSLPIFLLTANAAST